MPDNRTFKAKASEIIFSNVFFTFAAHAIVYQDIGRKHFGEFVFGGRAIAVGVAFAIMAVWASVHYFSRVALRSGLRRSFVFAFSFIVALCMASQFGLWQLGASLGVARLSVLIAGLLAWPIIAGAASFVSQIQEQDAVGPIAN